MRPLVMPPAGVSARERDRRSLEEGSKYGLSGIHFARSAEPTNQFMPARLPFRAVQKTDNLTCSDCPIAILPVEVLQEIFIWCLPAKPSHSQLLYHSVDLRGFTPRSAPLLLCQVSKLWSNCAISLPSLWTSLDVYVCGGKAQPTIPLATVWLTRSGGLPLSLALYQQNESTDNSNAAGEVLELYKRHIHRWSAIRFDLTGPRYCRLLTSEQQSAPILKQFRMQTSYRMYEEEAEKDLFGIFGIFASAPCLSQLFVSRIPHLTLAGDSCVDIPWQQLVSLSLDYIPSAGTALRILEKCASLTEASFKIDTVASPLPRKPIFHPLRSLNINIAHDQIASFLENATLSELTQLAVHVRGPLDQYGWPQRTFGDFLKRSECHLLHFEIHDTGMRFDEFASCLSDPYLQSVERIIVEDRKDWTWDPFVTDLALDLLTCSSFLDKSALLSDYGVLATHVLPAENANELITQMANTTCALPNLEAMSFRGSCLWSADGAVADMVESRWRFNRKGVRRLRRVELELLSSHVEDFRRLKEFGSEGLELDLDFR